MKEQLDRIINKLKMLRELDKSFHIFGSKIHKYKFNSCKSEEELRFFEKENNIILPLGYREFLKYIGNGGAGPYYGLEALENGRYVDLDYKKEENLIDLSKPFEFTESWNFDFTELEEMDSKTEEDEEKIERYLYENYYHNKFINGLLRISNFGCGVSINLVVNGKEKGKIWVDDRANDNGIYPDHYFENDEKLNFLDWYELWLDNSISEKKYR